MPDYTPVTYTGNGSTKTYSIAFSDYLKQSNVTVKVDGVTKTNGVDYTIDDATKQVTFVTAPSNGATILIERVTPTDLSVNEVSFSSGGDFNEVDMNDVIEQSLLIDQEIKYSLQQLEDSINEASSDLSFNTKAELVANTTTVANKQVAVLKGFYTAYDGGGGLFVADTTSSESSNGVTILIDANGVRWKSTEKGFLNVKRAGVVGDGATDDTAAIQTALDSGHKTLVFPAGDYLVSAQRDTYEALTVTGVSNLELIFMPGARLVGNPASNIEALVIEGGDDDSYAYSYSNLASDVAKGSNTIVLAGGEGANFSAGDWIKVVSEALLDGPMSTQGKKKGELVKIKSVSTDTLTLCDELHDSYATADTAKVAVAPMIENITIRGFNCNNLWRGLLVKWANNVTIENTVITNQVLTSGCGIAINDCVDVTIRNVHMDQAAYYGIQVDGSSRNVVIEDIEAIGTRHAVTTLANFTYGQVRNLTVRNGRAYASALSAWDTHEAGENVLFENLYSMNDGDHGVQIRAWKMKVRDCLIEFTNADSYSVELADCTEVEFIGCVSKNAGRDGYASKAVDTKFIDCHALDSTNRGFRTAGGVIQGGSAEDNDSAAIVYNSNATRGPLTIDGIYAPYSATQTVFLAGGDALNLDLKDITVINCVIPGYSVAGIWASGTGSAPFYLNNQLFTDSTVKQGLGTLTSGVLEVALAGLIADTDGGSFHRPIVPNIILTPVDGYYKQLTFDNTDVSTSSDWITGTGWATHLKYGIELTFGQGSGTIGGLTDTNSYFIARNSFPSSGELRLTDEFQPTLLDGGFTSALNGNSVIVDVDDSSGFSIGFFAVFGDLDSSTNNAYEIIDIPSGTQLELQTNTVADESIAFPDNEPVYKGGINFTSAAGTGHTLTPSGSSDNTALSVTGMTNGVGFMIKSGNTSETGRTVKWTLSY